MTQIKDALAKYWFYVSTLALTIFYALYLRRGQELRSLKSQIEVNKVLGKVESLNKKVVDTHEAFQTKLKKYEDLKRRYPDVLKRTGLL